MRTKLLGQSKWCNFLYTHTDVETDVVILCLLVASVITERTPHYCVKIGSYAHLIS